MKNILLVSVLIALMVASGYCQPATHNQNNPKLNSVTAKSQYATDTLKIGNWYIIGAAINAMLSGQTLVADTSGGMKRLIPGAGGAGSITVAGGSTYPGIDRLNLDSFFVVTQTIAGQANIASIQALGPWSSPEFYQMTTKPNGAIRMFGPNGAKYTTFIAQNSAGNFITVPTGNGTMVISAVAPFTIDPVTGQLGFSGAWTVPQGGTNSTVLPPSGALFYSNGSAYTGVTGTNNYFVRFGGSGPPTAFNLFDAANTWGAGQTFNAGVSATNVLFQETGYAPSPGDFTRQGDTLRFGTSVGTRKVELSREPVAAQTVSIPSGITPLTTIYMTNAGSKDIWYTVEGGYNPVGSIIIQRVSPDSVRFSTNGEELDQTTIQVYSRFR